METNTLKLIEAAVAAHDYGIAGAVRGGRIADMPFRPVITTPRAGRSTIPAGGTAFATREEAMAQAQRVIDARRAALMEQLSDPARVILRQRLGLPGKL